MSAPPSCSEIHDLCVWVDNTPAGVRGFRNNTKRLPQIPEWSGIPSSESTVKISTTEKLGDWRMVCEDSD